MAENDPIPGQHVDENGVLLCDCGHRAAYHSVLSGCTQCQCERTGHDFDYSGVDPAKQMVVTSPNRA